MRVEGARQPERHREREQDRNRIAVKRSMAGEHGSAWTSKKVAS